MSNFNWNYNPNDYSATTSGLLEEGRYGVRVINAKQTVAKNGTEGLEISLEVCGQSNKLKHFIWYTRETPARTNQLLGEFFNSFDIKPGEVNSCDAWMNKQGSVYVVQDTYKGRRIAKVAFCIAREQSMAGTNQERPVTDGEIKVARNDTATSNRTLPNGFYF